jgi:hypothetical protein
LIFLPFYKDRVRHFGIPSKKNGAAHEEDKDDFLIELEGVCSNQTSPLLRRGDFNLLRHSFEKNKE